MAMSGLLHDFLTYICSEKSISADNVQLAFDIMSNLPLVNRFDMAVMFVEDKERKRMYMGTSQLFIFFLQCWIPFLPPYNKNYQPTSNRVYKA